MLMPELDCITYRMFYGALENTIFEGHDIIVRHHQISKDGRPSLKIVENVSMVLWEGNYNMVLVGCDILYLGRTNLMVSMNNVLEVMATMYLSHGNKLLKSWQQCT